MTTWGTTVMPPSEWGAESRQVRVIVNAKTQKAAVEALNATGIRNMTAHQLRTYGAPTGNPIELAVAEAEPGVVFWAEDRHAPDADAFHRVEPKGSR